MLKFWYRQEPTPRQHTLHTFALFSTLSRIELRVVDSLLYERRFLKDEIIFDQGGKVRPFISSSRVAF